MPSLTFTMRRSFVLIHEARFKFQQFQNRLCEEIEFAEKLFLLYFVEIFVIQLNEEINIHIYISHVILIEMGCRIK